MAGPGPMAAKSSEKWDGVRRGGWNMHDNELKLMETLFHQLVSSCVDINIQAATAGIWFR